MINLDIPIYCNECSEFEPEVFKNEYFLSDAIIQYGSHRCNTYIRCKHEQRCDTIMGYLDTMYRNAKEK